MDDDETDRYISQCLAAQHSLDRGFGGIDAGSCHNPKHRYADWHGLPRAGLNGEVCPGSWNFNDDGTRKGDPP